MKNLQLQIASIEEWHKSFDPQIDGGGIFCPTTDPPEAESAVQLEVSFNNGPRFFLRGVVAWRRTAPGDQRALPGVGIRVLASERTKVSYINAWTRGGVSEKREVRRLPVRLRVVYTARSARRITFTRDISADGLFLSSQELFDVHTIIRLMLVPANDARPFELLGEVVRRVEDAEERGMAIVLQFATEKLRQRYQEFIVELENKYLAGQLGDDLVS